MKKILNLLFGVILTLSANAATQTIVDVNYAQLAIDKLSLNTDNQATTSGAAININGVSTYKFKFLTTNILPEANDSVTINNSVYFMLANYGNLNVGLYTEKSGLIGLLNLLKGDNVEIALSTQIDLTLFNLTETGNSTSANGVQIYSYSAMESGNASLKFQKGCYVHYIKVTREIEDPVVNDLTANATDVTANSATINVSYSVDKAPEGATYTVYYQTEDKEPQSVVATETGAKILLSDLTADTSYSYTIYVGVNEDIIKDTTATAVFTTLAESDEPTPETPSVSFYVNYAEAAVALGDNTQPVNQNKDQSIEINGKQLYQFSFEPYLSQYEVYCNYTLPLRFYEANGTFHIGLKADLDAIFAIPNLTEGQTVEIAYNNSSDGPSFMDTGNVSLNTDTGIYSFFFEYNSMERNIEYTVYSLTVTKTGPVVFTLPAEAYLAYIKVEPLATDGYYLVGTMTGGSDGDYQLNPSYKFMAPKEGSEDTSYTLSVGSVSSADKFYVVWVNNGISTPYSSTTDVDTDMEIGSNINMTANQTNALGLGRSYFNVLFTLTLDQTTDAPCTLTFKNGELNDNIWVITPGNDHTMQSGTVSENSITLLTLAKSAVCYIYAPSSFTDDTVYYEVTGGESTDRKMAKLADGNFQLSLTTGTSGDINVYADSTTSNKLATFTYEVQNGTPTAVEAVEASDGEAVYYNMQGVRVENPERGIFIKVENGKASKIAL